MAWARIADKGGATGDRPFHGRIVPIAIAENVPNGTTMHGYDQESTRQFDEPPEAPGQIIARTMARSPGHGR